MDQAPEQSIVSTRETLRRLSGSVRAFCTCELGGRAIAMAGVLLVLLLVINALNVVNSYVGRDFMTAIEQQDRAAFVHQALRYLGVFALLTVVAVLHRFTEERLGLMWRKWLTTRLIDGYLDRRLYYRLNLEGALANPDQRIADDVRSFTTTTLSLSLIFINGLFTIIAFSGVLWSISRLLFFAAVAYATVGSLLAFLFGRPLVRLNYQQSDREADFRSELVHVRENAEMVATSHQEPHLGVRLQRQLDALTDNFKRIIAVNRNLGFFTTGYNYLTQLIPVLIVAPLFIRGTVEFGVISQSTMAFAHLLGAFSLVVTQFPQLSSYAAVLARLSALAGAAESASARASSAIPVIEDESRLAFENVTLRSPHDGAILLRDLSLEVPRAGHVVLRLQSKVAASALERAVAGIWESGEGRIVRPPLERILLISERPYLPNGTLRELLVGVAPLPDDQIWGVLRRLDAESAVRRTGGLDHAGDWDDLLSLEEQRLIGLARVLLTAPRFAMLSYLDESLGSERAARILEALTQSGVGCLDLGNGSLGRHGRDGTFEVAADGRWVRHSESEKVA
jgi:putative ATP-binding cassette transporter